jgi:apolipoprotein N-acyltransferase
MSKLPRLPFSSSLGSWVNGALALLSAVLLILIFPGWNLVWLAAFALTPLLLAVSREPRPWRRFLLGYIAGIVYWFVICVWIQFVLEVHGGMGRWGGWGTFLLFCLIKAAHLGVFAMLAAIVLRHWYAIPAIAALWTGIERTHGDFGFAWLCLGNAGIDMGLPMRMAPWIGVYGLSFLFAMMGTATALVLLKRGRKQLLWLAATPALLLLPPLPEPERGAENAVVVQPNVPEEQDWTVDLARRMQQQLLTASLEQALSSKPRLIVWPEVPGPIYYYRDAEFREKAATLARTAHAYLLFGTVANTPKGAPLNSAVMLTPEGELVDRYDKINLVPFGEFVPKVFGFVNRITQEAGDFEPGNRVVVFPMGKHRVGTFICYESVFPQEVRKFAQGGADVLVNISNDGYFGHSAAREQHLEIVRMRAAENRRWILRATNDGVTAVIDPAGRVLKRLPMYTETAGVLEYSYMGATTFYTRHGDWFAWGCLLLGAAALFASQLPHYTPHRVTIRQGG